MEGLEEKPVIFEVGDKRLTLRPIKWGSYKKLRKLFESKDMNEADSIFGILKLLFTGPEHDFLTPEFFDENMTLPMSAFIIEKAVEMNGIGKVKMEAKPS